MEQMNDKSEYTFDAFISYSHRNQNWGKWLQRKLETFPIPNDMRGDRPRGQKLRIFRDQTDLAGTGLQDSLRQNLDVSEYLIVICSPASAASPWVNEEVQYFISLGRIDKIIPFIVDGEPESDDPALECFPKALRSTEGYTILGANIHEIGKNKAFLKVVSILLHVRFGRLVDREKQRKIRTALITGLTAAVIAAIIGTLLWQNNLISKKNDELNYDIYGAAIVSISQKDVIEPADVAFLKSSAEQGNTMAMVFLIDCYKHGWGIEKDDSQTFYWSQKGAELGDTVCMMSLANCYDDGIGTEQDRKKSFDLSLKAANAGNATGMFHTAICYEKGMGVEKDPVEAYKWYKKSALKGYDLGIYNLALCYRFGIGTKQNNNRAFIWMRKLALTGNALGMYNLGLMYQTGYGVHADPETAYFWYRKAADAGDADGAYMTGWCLENKYGVTDPALEWYKKAAALGNTQAEEALTRLSPS
ncbi:MAG: toll/interleukin-1 receptor domain-containing protein [Lachnospiraceae bacterium]|nr:toll/interleukin-1 receptor domain-containing protein [Lachnospiraceae bacterium]